MQTIVTTIPRRGLRLYQSILFDEPTHVEVKESKGRSALLIEKRDNLLLHRFYYKSKIERKIFEDALAELETEMHISKVMIQKIIQAKAEVLLAIKKQAITKSELKLKFPWITW